VVPRLNDGVGRPVRAVDVVGPENDSKLAIEDMKLFNVLPFSSMSTAVAVLLCGLVLPAGAGNPSPVARRVCHPDGLVQDPPVCYTVQDGERAPRHLPNVFGGPSTLGQCNFGHPGGSSGSMSRGHSCWTGSLFG